AVLSLLAGWAAPVRAARIQALASDGRRATAASTAGTLDMAFSIMTLPACGYLIGRSVAIGSANAILAAGCGVVWLAAVAASRLVSARSGR
ncbi:MAG: hypothetical protein FJZ01_27760, partial [Candidatus Sericytochromatia bacterium]|nr:hypothetical protein [Candidatus Tanganyikabacteria bacterium]